MKLYKGLTEDGSILCFDGQPLITNNPAVFYFLVDIQNDKIKRYNKSQEKAHELFGAKMHLKATYDLLTVVEATEEDLI